MSNNINARLNKATQNVKQAINTAGNTSITNKLTRLTNTFKNMFSASNNNSTRASNQNSNKNSNKNKSPNQNKSVSNSDNNLDNPFNNPIILWSLVIISLGFMIYGLYYYYTTTGTIQPAKSYYGADLLNYSPVFKLNTEQIDPCIKRCEADPLCDGITFNRDELTCVGTKRGLLREDDASLSAWVKPITGPESDKNKKSIILVGLAKENVVISTDKISYPGNPYEFNWSMYLYLNDHMANHGSWRHIMHKGSEVTDQIDTANWEDVLAQFPDQSVGIWMAPFNNNLRIALTTVSSSQQKNESANAYKHAYAGELDPATGNIFLTDKPNPPFMDMSKSKTKRSHGGTNYEKNIEFFDIYQFPVKKLKHLSVNVLTNTVEIYMDGMLYKVFSLTGKPEFNRGNLYVMKSKTVDGYIQKLSYSPAALKITGIRELL
jgi:hypothetical protein